MVGAAVAIVRGDLPFEMLDPMLACHSRVIVPMAPAEGLFLSRTRFFPFRTSFNQSFTVSLLSLPFVGRASPGLFYFLERDSDSLISSLMTWLGVQLRCSQSVERFQGRRMWPFAFSSSML
jgi:hypothetical protein